MPMQEVRGMGGKVEKGKYFEKREIQRAFQENGGANQNSVAMGGRRTLRRSSDFIALTCLCIISLSVFSLYGDSHVVWRPSKRLEISDAATFEVIGWIISVPFKVPPTHTIAERWRGGRGSLYTFSRTGAYGKKHPVTTPSI